MAIRDKIKAAPKTVGTTVEKTVLGEKIRVKVMSAADALNLREEEHFNQAMMQLAILDEKGDALFASKQEVMALPWGTYQAFQKAYLEVNGLDVEAAEKK